MGKASAGAAVGGKALSAASATVKFVAGVAGTAAGTAATVKTTQTAAKTIRDKNATTQEKAAAVFDAALSAAGTIGSAALAVKSFPAVKHEIGYYMAKYQCKAQNSTSVQPAQNAPTTQRPNWRQSEIEAAADYPDYEPQKSFLNGEDAKYGTKGSVRPDYYKVGHSVDIKNYNLESSSGRRNLVRNIVKQYEQRLIHLPEGSKQSVQIDLRGQNVSDEVLTKLYTEITQKTNGGVSISFKVK